MRLERELDEMGEETLTTKARKVLRKYDLPTAALDWGERATTRYRKACKAEGTSREDTNRWLMEGKLCAETEMIIVAAQDGVTRTRWYE